MAKVTKEQLDSLYLTEEMIDVFSKLLQLKLTMYKDKLNDIPFIRNIINIMFKNASTTEEKVYLYRFSVANQLKVDYDKINTMEMIEKLNPSLALLINQLNIEVRNLQQFMFIPKVGVKMDILIQ